MIQTSSVKTYSLYKSRRILHAYATWLRKKGSRLSPDQFQFLEKKLQKLEEALNSKDQAQASQIAHEIEAFAALHCRKTPFEYTKELVGAIVFALIVATIVRQMWFEPYEIPTGSMRPTFEEQDRVFVTKTAFGINVPLKTSHFYFDPNLVQRTSVVIWSGDQIPLLNSDTTYFGLFPAKKRYVKRCMGKPGDVLYFYGGQIYGIDKEGKPLEELLQAPWLEKLEHVPFINFEGEISAPSSYQILFSQMHQPVGKLTVSPNGELKGEVYNGREWIPDNPVAQKTPHQKIETYSDFWGIRNYAMVRLLTKEEIEARSDLDKEGLESGVLYLELRHTPSFSYPKPDFYHSAGGMGVLLSPYSTVIPLQQHHLDALMNHMYTARFVVKDGLATRYNASETHFTTESPAFPGVSDGTYEFYYGKASTIGWQGITSPLPSSSLLYWHDPLNVQKLFNLGIEMSNAYSPREQPINFMPHRYAYFREGALYLLGAPVLKADDPALVAFNEREMLRERKSSSKKPYVAFRDYGPPVKDGKFDVNFLRTFGFIVPDGQYLLLGDNHAMSSDSRVFGCVPEANLQGAPCWIVWPPGERWGAPVQKPYPLLVLPRLIVWGCAAAILIIALILYRRRLYQPLFFSQTKNEKKG